MRMVLFSFAIVVSGAWAAEPVVTGLKNPESLVLGPDGAAYVTEIGEFNKDGDGKITIIEDGNTRTFTEGLNDPKGIALFLNKEFYLTDKDRIVRVDLNGKATTYIAKDKFPVPPIFLNDIVAEPELGMLYVSDSGENGEGGRVFRVNLKNAKVDVFLDSESLKTLKAPNGLAMDGAFQLLVGDFATGELHRVNVVNRSATKVAEGFKGCDGLCYDMNGRLFITSWSEGKLWSIPRPGVEPILVKEGYQGSADLGLEKGARNILIPEMLTGNVHSVSVSSVPGWEVDDSPLPLKAVPAFTNLKWKDWKQENENGTINIIRPIVLTHAGDESNRIFVALQEGIIHVFPNDEEATETSIFLDISKKVRFKDMQNEEGFLGLAFHPDFATNGEFFVFYTDVKAKMDNVVSRFRVSKKDPRVADPDSEEEILRISKPYWNHDGGTIAFGPDGYLYIAHGDGGSGGDPHQNGQKLTTHLGKILRIDINQKSPGRNYAIPKDNPFSARDKQSREIWAYGLRNVWRMSFDRETGALWAADVGQNLFEEINIITKGGNYGWSLRESLHPFGPNGIDAGKETTDPIWEYHHDIGKSITGGLTYRGKSIPELEGHYLYADYLTSRVWALKYDQDKKRVVANHDLFKMDLPVPTFGEDEEGEAYILIHSPNPNAIYKISK